MFGFFKKRKERKIIDKIIMGAVIGGAIGSVIGAGVSAGSNHRKKDEEALPVIPKKEKFLVKLLKKVLRKEKKQKPLAREIPNEMAVDEHEKRI